jgi:peroxiredoxin
MGYRKQKPSFPGWDEFDSPTLSVGMISHHPSAGENAWSPSYEAKLKSFYPGAKPPDTGLSDHGSSTASLASDLAAYRARSRQNRPDYVKAYDDLVGRLLSIDRGEVGPKIGEPMPAFRLPDENGRLVSLTLLLESGPAVVSFNRGHWCPYCKLELRALAAIHDRITQLGARIVSIMPDKATLTTDFAQENDLPFPVLSDIDLGYSLSLGLIFWVGAEVQRLYKDVGVDLEKYQGNAGHFLPMAAKFIVGQDGLVKARQVNIEFRERMEPDAIIAALARLRA